MRHGITALFAVAAGYFLADPGPTRAELIVNGSFEQPTVTSANEFETILPGAEPVGFGWRVISGNVDAVVQGPTYALSAYDGVQFLDLDGTMPGAIAQSFATTPGHTYALSFAYANNPVTGATIPAQGTLTVFDTSTAADLIAPILLTHGSSLIGAPDWVSSGAILFEAQGVNTTISFASDNPGSSLGGLFLDAVSVVDVTPSAIPEPSSFALVFLGAACVAVMRACRRKRNQPVDPP